MHNYSFNWVSGNLLRKKKMVRYGNLNAQERAASYDENWGFVMADSFVHQAPVILGEFGCSGTSQGSEAWFRDLTSYLDAHEMSFFWWDLEEDLKNPGSYGIMNQTLDSINVHQDWRWKYWEKLFDQPTTNASK